MRLFTKIKELIIKNPINSEKDLKILKNYEISKEITNIYENPIGDYKFIENN
jgi:hypothetical protein